MSQMLPPGLMDALQGAQGGPGGPPMAPDYGDATAGPGAAPDPLQTLQTCIQALPGVISALPDPRDTQDAIRALQILAGIQTRLMSSGGGQGGGGPSGGPSAY